MKTFLRDLCLFLVPYAILLAVVVGTLWSAGELTPLADVVAAKSEACPVLLGLAYTRPNPTYKVLLARETHPDVLILGTSRVMQFRDYFFPRKVGMVYNAGGGIRSLGDVTAFLQALPVDHSPLVVLGLDQSFFNTRWRRQNRNPDLLRVHAARSSWRALKSYRDLVSDLTSSEFSLTDVISTDTPLSEDYFGVGLLARSLGKGFRPDGSYCYGQEMREPDYRVDTAFETELARISTGTLFFEYGAQVDPDSIKEVADLLALCKERGVRLVAYLSPFAPSVYEAIQQSGKYGYMDAIPDAIGPLFASEGLAFQDLTDAELWGASDEEFLDGFHPSEVATLRILIKLTETASELRDLVDREDLEDRLNARKSPTVL